MYNENYENTYSTGLTFNKFMAKTFGVMFIGLVITAVVALVSFNLLMTLINNLGFMFFLLLAVAQIGLTIFFSTRLESMSKSTAYLCFFIYCAMTGLTMSSIPYFYDGGTIALALFITAGMFGSMAIIGHTSNIDFSKFTPYLMFGLIASIVITLINNIFIHSAGVSLFMDYAVIIIFLVMIAYDMQKLRRFYSSSSYDLELSNKLAIFAALSIYLDFVNIFLRVLSILSRNNDN